MSWRRSGRSVTPRTEGSIKNEIFNQFVEKFPTKNVKNFLNNNYLFYIRNRQDQDIFLKNEEEQEKIINDFSNDNIVDNHLYDIKFIGNDQIINFENNIVTRISEENNGQEEKNKSSLELALLQNAIKKSISLEIKTILKKNKIYYTEPIKYLEFHFNQIKNDNKLDDNKKQFLSFMMYVVKDLNKIERKNENNIIFQSRSSQKTISFLKNDQIQNELIFFDFIHNIGIKSSKIINEQVKNYSEIVENNIENFYIVELCKNSDRENVFDSLISFGQSDLLLFKKKRKSQRYDLNLLEKNSISNLMKSDKYLTLKDFFQIGSSIFTFVKSKNTGIKILVNFKYKDEEENYINTPEESDITFIDTNVIYSSNFIIKNIFSDKIDSNNRISENNLGDAKIDIFDKYKNLITFNYIFDNCFEQVNGKFKIKDTAFNFSNVKINIESSKSFFFKFIDLFFLMVNESFNFSYNQLIPRIYFTKGNANIINYKIMPKFKYINEENLKSIEILKLKENIYIHYILLYVNLIFHFKQITQNGSICSINSGVTNIELNINENIHFLELFYIFFLYDVFERELKKLDNELYLLFIDILEKNQIKSYEDFDRLPSIGSRGNPKFFFHLPNNSFNNNTITMTENNNLKISNTSIIPFINANNANNQIHYEDNATNLLHFINNDNNKFLNIMIVLLYDDNVSKCFFYKTKTENENNDILKFNLLSIFISKYYKVQNDDIIKNVQLNENENEDELKTIYSSLTERKKFIYVEEINENKINIKNEIEIVVNTKNIKYNLDAYLHLDNMDNIIEGGFTYFDNQYKINKVENKIEIKKLNWKPEEEKVFSNTNKKIFFYVNRTISDLKITPAIDAKDLKTLNNLITEYISSFEEY